MPSVSQAQNRFMHAKAAAGEAWAKKWLREDKGHEIASLPERKHRRLTKDNHDRMTRAMHVSF